MIQNEYPISYAVRHKDEGVRAESRSGGIFTALSDETLDQSGVVYGCVLNDKFLAKHVRAESKADRDRMRGSKYIQSNMGTCFEAVKSDLEGGRSVLFTGTGCQISGLKGYLGKDCENLLCVDIVCHGVPSPRIWRRYLKWISRGKNISEINFRNKEKFGWADHVITVTLDNGKQIDDKAFVNLFGRFYIERPSCFKCPYKNIKRPGDITIADYWGIKQAAPEFNDNKGVSLVLVNNEKGAAFFECVKNTVRYKQTDMKDSMQPALIAPFPMPKDRDQFWKDEGTKSFSYIVGKYAEDKPSIKLKKTLRRIYRKVIHG